METINDQREAAREQAKKACERANLRFVHHSRIFFAHAATGDTQSLAFHQKLTALQKADQRCQETQEAYEALK